MNVISTKKFIPIKSVIRLVTIMVLIVIASFYIVTGMFLYIITEKEQESVESRIELAFEIEYKHNVDVLKEYSYWDEAYDKLVLNVDQKWIDKNINNYIFKMYDYDWWGIEKSDQVHLLASRKDSNVNNTLIENIKINKLSFENYKTRKYEYIGKDLYEIISVPFTNEITKERYKENLVMGVKIDDLYLKRLMVDYGLPKIFLTKYKEAKVLVSSDNESKSYLHWWYKSPTNNIIPYMGAIGLVLLLTFIVMIRKILSTELKENAEYEEALYSAATRDSLTNIANRRFFFDHAKKEFNLLTLEKRDLSILLLDIDYFKKINDKYGHSVGDQALIHFSQVTKSVLRSNDLIGRIGGEEFAVFLPDATEQAAHQIADRIHKELKEKPLKINESISHDITVSIGAVTNEDKMLQLEDLMIIADKALYKSKDNGRNQTSFCKHKDD